MNDVAEKAGVSKATVSHVINSTRFVESATRERVLQVIEELDYHPNALARSLTTQRTGIIGMVISDASNHFFSEMLRGVEDVLRSLNYGLIVCNTEEVLEWEDHYLALLLGQRVDGIIAAAASQRWSALTQAEQEHTPIVLVDRVYEQSEWPYVGVDNEQGAYMGTSRLIECGHRRIGIVAGLQRLSTMRERGAGFRRALQEHNIPLPDGWNLPCDLSIEGGRQATRQLLSMANRPDALFTNNNLLSLGALLAIKEMGLRCPDDVGLVGFDDHPWAAVSEPPLTVVAQPGRQLGETAAKTLCAILSDDEAPAKSVILNCELVIRQSCCVHHSGNGAYLPALWPGRMERNA